MDHSCPNGRAMNSALRAFAPGHQDIADWEPKQSGLDQRNMPQSVAGYASACGRRGDISASEWLA